MTKRSVHSIREFPAGNIPDWSYPNRYDPQDLWTVPPVSVTSDDKTEGVPVLSDWSFVYGGEAKASLRRRPRGSRLSPVRELR